MSEEDRDGGKSRFHDTPSGRAVPAPGASDAELDRIADRMLRRVAEARAARIEPPGLDFLHELQGYAPKSGGFDGTLTAAPDFGAAARDSRRTQRGPGMGPVLDRASFPRPKG